MLAITPNRAKRGKSGAAICWACSMRNRRSRHLLRHSLEDIELGPDGAVADGVHHDVEAGLSAPDTHRYRLSGVFTNRPVSFGASVNGCSMAAVWEPAAVDEPLERADPKPRIATPARRTVSRKRSHVDNGTAA